MSFKDVQHVIGRIDKLFFQSFSALIILGGATICLTVVLEVVLRYIFKAPLFGLEEFSRTIAIWVYFLGAIFGTKYDGHVQGDVAARLFPTPRSSALVKVVVWTLSLAACCLFLYHASTYSLWLYETGERTTGLWWPRITSVGSMAFGAVFMTLYSLVNVFKYLAATLAAFGRRGGESS
ncbi:MAG: TRAP transporter small permease subunit [Thermodesulfobacteriota bacterium]